VDLLLPKAGRYEFRLIINRDVKGYLPIDVVLIDEPAGQEPCLAKGTNY
jgi:hypothetical protein